jgi:23S rRNA (cytosine1962-C5)-methyltransferase
VATEFAQLTAANGQWFDLPPRCVLYEDESLIVVDKPAGIPSQAVSADDTDLPALLRRFLAQRRGQVPSAIYLGTHQRLDQDTSGALVHTLTREANPELAAQFEARQIGKRYLAAVSGRPPTPGTLLTHWLAPGRGGAMRIAQPDEPGAKQARTRVLARRQEGSRSLLSLAIETGRTHQIRLQLSAAGCPVAGDRLYDGAPALRLLLHAEHLTFRHPRTGQALSIECPPPDEFADWLAHGPRSVFASRSLLGRALQLALARRHRLFAAYEAGSIQALRLVNGAADGCEGVYLDVYDRWLVARVDAAADSDRAEVERSDECNAQERMLFEALPSLGLSGAYLKRHPKQASRLSRASEQEFAPRLPIFGAAAPERLRVHEHGVPFFVRLGDGLRTGLFLDQRDNRQRLRAAVSGGRVLNLFGYTGSFSVVALLGDAREVVTVDLSRAALQWADENVAAVGATDRHRSVCADAFVALRGFAARGERFDWIILDPPSYSTSKHGRFRAAKDYPKLCAQALEVLNDGGRLLACINHQGVSQGALRHFIEEAAHASGLSLRSLRDAAPPTDFPASVGAEPAMKSVLAEFGERRRLHSVASRPKFTKSKR